MGRTHVPRPNAVYGKTCRLLPLPSVLLGLSPAPVPLGGKRVITVVAEVVVRLGLAVQGPATSVPLPKLGEGAGTLPCVTRPTTARLCETAPRRGPFVPIRRPRAPGVLQVRRLGLWVIPD